MDKNLSKLLSPHVRTLSFIPRWQILWRIRENYLSDHSYFVTYYSFVVAKMIDFPDKHFPDLVWYAMTHDWDELVSGDIQSPAKTHLPPQFRTNMLNMIDDMFDATLGIEPPIAGVKAIVKVADKMDWCFHLLVEERLGNKNATTSVAGAFEEFKKAWYDLPAPHDKLTELWRGPMHDVISKHHEIGGRGIWG